VLYLGSPENNETAGDAAVRYTKSAEDLADKLQKLLDDPIERQHWAELAVEHARRHYRWDEVADKYEKLFEELRKQH